MTPFELMEPQTLQEAVGLLDPDDASVRPVAGGTALMLMMKAGVFAPTRLVSLQHIGAQHSEIGVSGAGELRIGAMATLSALERNTKAAEAFPVIARMLPRLSNVRVRNVACVGGALAHGDPHMDLPPVLAALGAKVSIVGPKESRDVAVDELYTGYYETVVGRNELIADVIVPAMQSRKAAYLKITARSADDWPALGVAVALHADGNTLRDVRLVASAATAMVMRLTEAEKILNGASADDATLKRAGDAAVAEAPIIGDIRGSVAYKRELLRVGVGRAVRQALSSRPTH
ncbi:MAG: xanthine dehydrogenase family protein subunit M [Rhizobiales bacterium]|nr:xanthine dehydrogenase family protein subunit M [Hyphomicrobiales bacterium]